MIKVLYIIDTLEGYGAEKSLVEITTNLKNVIPVFVHIYQGDMLKSRLEEAGIRVYSLDLSQKYAFNTAVKKLETIYLQEQPDIVHATLFRSEIIARKLKKSFPEIFLVGSFVSNAYSPERFRKKGSLDKLKLYYFQNLDKRSTHLVDHFISNSHTIRNNTAKALGIGTNKVSVIYRGRKSANFDPLKIESDLPYLNNKNQILLNVSRLIPLKGQLDLLKAMPEVVKVYPQIQLVFAGHGSFRENLERHALNLGVQDNTRFLGRIDNIQKLLVKADIFLYPSYSEGLPGALIEAMMAERIIIVSDIPENLECVDKNCALIYKKGNVTELTSIILKVLKNPEKYRPLARNAKSKATEKFELEKVVGGYEDFYIKAVRKEKLEPGILKKKGLKILHLIQKPQNRGAETFTTQIGKHQLKNGHEVLIVSIFSGKANLDWPEIIPSLEGNEYNRLLDFPAWHKLNRIIEAFEPDVIQANAGDTLKYAVLSKKVFNWKAPIIFRNASQVGQYLHGKFQRSFNSYLYKSVDHIISVSEASEKDIVKNFPFLSNLTSQIPIGLEHHSGLEQVCFESPEPKNIVHVGGFTFEKNHKGLIEIFKNYHEQGGGAHLHLVGDGPLRSEIEEMVKQKGLDTKVSFYGFVSNPLSYIKAADVLVLPSIIEGLPGVLLEAMYCKIPVIAYDVGGVSEIINDQTGELIPKNDTEQFVIRLFEVLSKDQNEKVCKAKEMVDNHFMNSVLVKDFTEIYKSVKASVDQPNPKF